MISTSGHLIPKFPEVRFHRTRIFNCAFSNDHKCVKFTDYEITRHELEEADELCHVNWIEIQHLREYIDRLQALLIEHGITIPDEY